MTFCWCPPGSFHGRGPKGPSGRFLDAAPARVTLSRGFGWVESTSLLPWPRHVELTHPETRAEVTRAGAASGISRRGPSPPPMEKLPRRTPAKSHSSRCRFRVWPARASSSRRFSWAGPSESGRATLRVGAGSFTVGGGLLGQVKHTPLPPADHDDGESSLKKGRNPNGCFPVTDSTAALLFQVDLREGEIRRQIRVR